MPMRTMLRACPSTMLGLATLLCAPAQAETWCADTTSELVFALATAANSAEDDDVRVRSGTFSITSNIDLVVNGALTVRGGWSLNCLLQSNDPGASVITTATPGQYNIRLRPRDGGLTIERLTFDRLDGVVLQDSGDSASVVADINLQRNRFIINDFGPIVRVRDKRVRIENNIITGSLQRSLQFDRSTATAPITADIHNNTLVGGTEGIRVSGTVGAVRVRNNVLDGNYAGGGLVIVDGVVAVNHNSLDGGFSYIGGGSASPSFDNDLVIDPMFDAAFVPQAGSPLINSGTNSIVGGLPSVDFAGGQRRIGSRVDRGARESTISDVDTLTVTSSANSGAGTLRQAILDANVTAIEETIAFDIPGSCPRVITLSTPLPTISSTLTLDGFTQPGSSPNDRPDDSNPADNSVHCVVLASDATATLNLTPGPGQMVTVRGFAFYRATEAQIRVSGSGGATVLGNTFSTGTSLLEPNVPQYAISVDDAPDTRIGGNDPADRNIIGRASLAGVRLGPGMGREVIRNFIGLSKSSGDAGNRVGVLVIDGQFDSVDGNCIGHNDLHGLRVEGAQSVMSVQRNQIGLRRAGVGLIVQTPNGSGGIWLAAGEIDPFGQNTIAFNRGDGIAVLSAARRIDLGINRIYENDGLGFDLPPNGVNSNDTDTGGSGTNGGQNYPVLSAASGATNAGQVAGTLQSANGTYEITLYASADCDPTGHGEGRDFIGTASVTISNGTASVDGNASFIANVANASINLNNDAITATAAHRGGPNDGNTSEFSACTTPTSMAGRSRAAIMWKCSAPLNRLKASLGSGADASTGTVRTSTVRTTSKTLPKTSWTPSSLWRPMWSWVPTVSRFAASRPWRHPKASRRRSFGS